MENYIVSARKYRPGTFESVVGQQNLTQTLRNAIATRHLAQAYLFCGPRGVGKTTCARIFAKTINCLHPTDEHEACNDCESCNAFNEQRSFNIHELDAASNNSVENIRILIEQVRIPPQIGKYSVFIIDEVHMLSKDAFNALLKTLEEPPSYAVFILATTEKNKVIPTILSRCQVYDFSRITVGDIIRHLQYVARNEGIEVSEEALNVVAQKADGGMRDALSIFDQLVSFCGNSITYEQAVEILNVLDTDYYFRLVESALGNKVGEALLLFNDVLAKGFDAQNFVVGLGGHLRDVLVSKDPQTAVLLETSDNIRQNYIRQAQQCSVQFLLKALDFVNDCDINYRQSKNKRLTVELALIKLCQLTMPAQEQPAGTPLQAVNTPQPQYVAASRPAVQPTAARPAAQPATQPVAQPQRTVMQPQDAAPVLNNAAPKRPVAGLPKQISIRTQPSPAPASASLATSSAASSVAPAAVRDKAFTQEEFDKVWLTLPSYFPKEERLKAMLLNARTEIAEQVHIRLTLANRLQEEEVQHCQSKILAHLRDALQNDRITLHTRVEEMKTGTAFTAADRYRNLTERNPELDNLKTALGLQLE